MCYNQVLEIIIPFKSKTIRVYRDKVQNKYFVEKISRYTALGTYLKTFVEGIKKHKTEKNFLYPQFMQCVTATGRLSSRDPNFQNQPRAKTFPIRKVINSRFKNGKIITTN